MKKLVNKKELRDKMNIAIDMLSSVKVTLGPKGENVIINVEGEYVYSDKKAALITGDKTTYETKFDSEIDSRIIGL